jgi:HPt (histidine-containing phosphotransfer) domain-containing protein
MANRLFQLKEQLNKMDLMKKMGVYLNEDLRPDIEAEIKLLEQEPQHTILDEAHTNHYSIKTKN